jgi:hypothetical protein
MANIASATVTLHGKVSGRVVSLTANGTAVTLASGSFTCSIPVTADRLVLLTTIDLDGRSESRSLRIESESVPYLAPVPA